jgi:hypothetical protein
VSENKNFFAYFAVKKPENEPLPSFAFGKRDHVTSAIERWNADADGSSRKTEQVPEEPEFTHQSALTEALKASVDFGLAQYELIEAAAIAPMIMRIAMMRGEIIGFIESEAQKIDDNKSHVMYGLNEKQFATVIERYEKYAISKKGLDRFPSAVLLSLVATFDTLVLDILTKMLKLQSDWLERSERSVPISRIASADSLEEIIHEQILEEVYQFSRGSHSEQAGYIKRNFGIDIAKDWKRWADYIEIFERRNLVAHGETKFNARYVRICQEAGHKGAESLLGVNVELRDQYLKQSLNILVEFAVLLSFSLFRKFVKDSEDQAFTNLNEAIYKLIQKGHYTVSERLSDYALTLNKVNMKTETRLMIVVNRASAIRHAGRFEESNQALRSEDWSAVSDLFKVCIASILDDFDEFGRLLAKIKASGDLSVQSILTWPCFSFARNSKDGQKIIKDVFNIDLSDTKEGDDEMLEQVNSSSADGDKHVVH